MKKMRMKKITASLFLAGSFCAISSGCLKNNSNNTPATSCEQVTTTAPADEILELNQRLNTNGVYSKVQDPRGFFYTMDSTAVPDSGAHATPCSNVAVTYSVSQLGDTTFEKSDSVIALSLVNSIIGWKEAVPLMKKNAIMTLYLPPSLAYGSAGYLSIPGNAYLAFVIKLYDYSN